MNWSLLVRGIPVDRLETRVLDVGGLGCSIEVDLDAFRILLDILQDTTDHELGVVIRISYSYDLVGSDPTIATFHQSLRSSWV